MTAALKRLSKEYKELLRSPIPGVGACPLEDDALVWHANIMVPLTVGGAVAHAPLHLVIAFKPDYPASPPSAGCAC